MSEQEAVKRTRGQPATVESMTADLTGVGVVEGMVLLDHSSLGSMNWVCGGVVEAILALEKAVGASGTLVMPMHSADLCNPTSWENPPVPKACWQTIRRTMPAYRPQLTPTRGMGTIPETFRK